jgi:hypothetical protein
LSAEPTRKQALVAGGIALATGLGSAAAIHLHPEGLRAPAWVAYAAVSTFVLAGMALLAGALGAKRVVPWLGALIVCGLLVPGLWIALGAGGRECSFSLGFLSGAASEFVCRGAFGAGALLCLVFLVLLVSRASRAPAAPSLPGKRD